MLNYMDLTQYITGVTVPKLTQANLKNILLPLPPIDIQKNIVSRIENIEKEILTLKNKIESNKKIIEKMISGIWGE